MYNEYLAHHGIKGQSWGVQHGPPYPVERAAGGKPKTTKVVKSKLKASLDKRAANSVKRKADMQDRVAKIKDQRAQKAAEKKVDDFERLKKRVVSHPKDLYKLKDQFSKKEIEDLIKEIDFDRKIKDVKVQETKRWLDSYARMKDVLSTTYQVASAAKGIYNIAAEVNNAMIASGKSNGTPWTKLGGEFKKEEKKDEKKS